MKNIKLILFVVTICGLTGCIKDYELDVAPARSNGTTTDIILQLNDETVVETRSETTNKERNMLDVYVLVFDRVTGKYKAGERNTTFASNTNKIVPLKHGLVISVGDRVVVLANATTNGLNTLKNKAGGATVDDINTAFPSGDLGGTKRWNFNTAGDGRGVPMSGSVVWSSGSNVVDMYHSCAKLNVVLDKKTYTDLTGVISSANVYYQVYNKPSMGNIYAPVGEISSPASGLTFGQYTAAKGDKWVGIDQRNALDFNPTVSYYIPEYESSVKAKGATVDINTFDADRLCVILQVAVRDYYGNTMYYMYYRLDFVEGNGCDERKKYIDIVRNNHYKFNITKIGSFGYPTVEEAMANPSSNVEYSIIETDTEWNSTTSNGQYAIKSDKSIAIIRGDTNMLAPLCKFTCQMPETGSGQGSDLPSSITTRKVSLLTCDYEGNVGRAPSYIIQLCKSDGTPCENNTFEFTDAEAKTAGGYQLMYYYRGGVTYTNITKKLYLEIQYGNVRHHVTTPIYYFTASKLVWANYIGGSYMCGMYSYKSSNTGDRSDYIYGDPVPYKMEFSTDNGLTWSDEKPQWITFTHTTPETGNAVYGWAQPYVTVSRQNDSKNAHNVALRATAPVSNYDLSTKGGSTLMNTANCYVVNAPGTYSLPLVYGKLIKNGTVNTACYNYTCLNHLNATITDPYIYNNANCTPASACLGWQDEKDLITNVELSADGHNITFTVGQETIRQGNATIYVRNASKTVMWSWHIWVTDQKIDNDTKTYTNSKGTFEFAALPLGFCSGETADERIVDIRMTQNESGFVKRCRIAQDDYMYHNAPYYQWGRKDPSVAGIASGVKRLALSNYNHNKYHYTNNMRVSAEEGSVHIYGEYLMSWSDIRYTDPSNSVPISSLITRPNDFIINTGGGLYSLSGQLWEPESIYNPAPVGYKVPSIDAYYGIAGLLIENRGHTL